MNIRF